MKATEQLQSSGTSDAVQFHTKKNKIFQGLCLPTDTHYSCRLRVDVHGLFNLDLKTETLNCQHIKRIWRDALSVVKIQWHSPGTGSVEPEKWLATMATVDVAKINSVKHA